MRALIILMYCLIFTFYSCNIRSQSNLSENSTEQENANQTLINHMFDKMVARLNTVNISNPERDSVISQILTETNFQNLTTVPIQLTGKKCPFVPYMLVVHDNKLDLLSIKLDSTYTLDLKDKIQTAYWSPFNMNEIFILTIDEKRKPGNKYTYATNRKLFCLNLDSMQLSYLTTFIDYGTPIYKLYFENYEPPTFFYDMSTMEIDLSKKRICLQCFYPWDEDGDLPNLLTYNYDISTKKTKLSKKLNIKTSQFMGEKLESAKENYSGLDSSNYIASNDSIKLLLPFKNHAEIKIPISVFTENDMEVTYPGWRFHAYFLKNRIIFSVSKEDAMAIYKGHVYLMNTKGKLLKMLGKDMGEFFQLSELEHHNYLIDPDDSNFNGGIPGLYLYDSDFHLLKHYKNVYCYELNQ